MFMLMLKRVDLKVLLGKIIVTVSNIMFL